MQFKIGDTVEIIDKTLRRHVGEIGEVVELNHTIPWPIIVRAINDDDSEKFCCRSDEIRKVEQ